MVVAGSTLELPDRGDAHWLGAVRVSQGGKTLYAWNDTEGIRCRSFMPRGADQTRAAGHST